MLKTITQLLMFGMIVALTACGGGGGGGDDDTGGGSSLSLVNAFGTTITSDTAGLNTGISTACYSADGAYQKSTITATGSTFTLDWNGYVTADCSGTATSLIYVEATITTGADAAILSWVDGNNDPIAAPNGLPETAAYTPLTITIDVVSGAFAGSNKKGDPVELGYIIDDSQSGSVALYEVYRSQNKGRAQDPFIKTL